MRLSRSTEHPRARGENYRLRFSTDHGVGTSPRTRGKRKQRTAYDYKDGNIPAHAGKTNGLPIQIKDIEEHPRARGENQSRKPWAPHRTGTSPRTRGKRGFDRRGLVCIRNIPAHAGKTRSGVASSAIPSEHPRARGENMVSRIVRIVIIGTSPRTRGKLFVTFPFCHSWRNIPAHAGKTAAKVADGPVGAEHPRARGKTNTVYNNGIRKAEHPRARGENCECYAPLGAGNGTSPRTRGKHG